MQCDGMGGESAGVDIDFEELKRKNVDKSNEKSNVAVTGMGRPYGDRAGGAAY